MSPQLTLNYAACSDRGLVRGNNEDSAYAGPRLLALADGMGGHAAGEVASAFMIDALKPLDSPLIEDPEHSERLETLLATAMDEGNQNIAMHVQENPTLAGMGCTLTSLLFRGNEIGLCHVGDSRGYRLRDGELEQITTDDTFVQSLVEQGKLNPADVSSHPQRSLILKALTGRPVEPTLSILEAQPGDRYMLCSDGLSDPVSFDTMVEILRAFPPAQAARKLVEMALRGGGPDNVTVVVADVVDFDANSDAPVDSKIKLPSSPVLVGAVGGEAADEDRPDSPASRAAALSNLRTTNSQSAPSAPAAADTAEHKEEPTAARPQKKPRSKKLWAALGAVLVILALVGAAGFLGYKKVQNTYYVAEQDSRIVINRGLPEPVLGIQLSSHFQDVCLTENSTLLLLDEGSTDNCHRFATTDLTPAARGALESLPEDNYDAVVQQVQRLSEQTLPVCVTRSPAASNSSDSSKTSSPSASSSAEATSESEANSDRNTSESETSAPNTTARATDTSTSQSTHSAAPEDLTTPGVSCREVK